MDKEHSDYFELLSTSYIIHPWKLLLVPVLPLYSNLFFCTILKEFTYIHPEPLMKFSFLAYRSIISSARWSYNIALSSPYQNRIFAIP